MHMSFWWSYKLEDFLFYGFNVNSKWGLAVTWIGFCAISFTFEWLKLLQARLRQKELFLRARKLRAICPTESSTLLSENTTRENIYDVTLAERAKLFAYEVFLWFSLQNMGYLLMLTVMLYNAWLVIAIVAGGGLGYFIFGQSFMKINLQNCQILRDTYCMTFKENRDNTEDGETTPAMEHASSSGVPSSTHSHSETSVSVHV